MSWSVSRGSGVHGCSSRPLNPAFASAGPNSLLHPRTHVPDACACACACTTLPLCPPFAQPADGDTTHNEENEENQSVRPGSIVSNLEQRLDEIDVFGGDGEREEDSRGRKGRIKESYDAEREGHDGGGAGSSSFHAIQGSAEQQYMLLLQQMQHRDLTPSDLLLLRQLEEQRDRQSLPPFGTASPQAGSQAAGSTDGSPCHARAPSAGSSNSGGGSFFTGAEGPAGKRSVSGWSEAERQRSEGERQPRSEADRQRSEGKRRSAY